MDGDKLINEALDKAEGQTDMVTMAANRMVENLVYFKSFDTKGMTKGDLLLLLNYAVEYPLQQVDPKFNTTKLESLASLLVQIIKDKTIITIASMGGKFTQDNVIEDETLNSVGE